MNWIAPSEKDGNRAAREKRLWEAADQLCANSAQHSQPAFGLIFLRFAGVRLAVRVSAARVFAPARVFNS
jgi:hypothetical protein